MRFEYAAALAALVLVVMPFVAHLLRLRRPRPRDFPPASLVPASAPEARSRSRLEDRSLLALRAFAVLAAVVLGAMPLVRCSRLAMSRASGASVAMIIVIDDSSSMHAVSSSGPSRFEVAARGALDLISGARDGDIVGIVLAGDPARVVLVPTADRSAAAAVVRELRVSDRATDLDGALALAQGMLEALPQTDRRIVVLSDLADGKPEAAPIGSDKATLWAPRQGFDDPGDNCALLRADRTDRRVLARVVCTSGRAARGRSVAATRGGAVIVQGPLGVLDDDRISATEVTLELPDSALNVEEAQLVGGSDIIAHDDRAPVAPPLRGSVVAVVSDPSASRVATGGPPPVEQALAALGAAVTVRPLPAVPETVEELSPLAGLVLDDPPGLTPEAREAVRRWLEAGGVALAALGPRSASAPLGASLEPFVAHNIRWETNAPAGVDVNTAAMLGPSAASLEALNPSGRIVIEGLAADDLVAVRWADGAPWLLRRNVGHGMAVTLTLPMSLESSDLVVRPAFLALLLDLVESASSKGGSRRIDVGGAWSFPSTSQVEQARGQEVLEQRVVKDRKRVTPRLAGRYDLRVDGVAEARFATIPEREIDLRRRKLVENATSASTGSNVAWVDLSRYLALVLLAVFAGEMVLRFLHAWRDRPTASA